IFVTDSDLAVLNNTFGFNLATLTSTAPFPRAVSGTIFDSAAASLTSNDATSGLDPNNLPAGAINVYGDGTGSEVTLIPFGQGEIIFLGWDWFDSNPPDTASGQDGGWQSVLAAALADADLAVTKAASVSTAGVGQPFTWTVTVTNNGPNDAVGVS